MPLLRRKKKPVAPTADDPLNAAALERALKEVDFQHASIAEFKAQIASWEEEKARLLEDGDPTNPSTVAAITTLSTRLQMAPAYLSKGEAEVQPLVEALLGEVRAFEVRLLETGVAEIARFDAAIVPALRPYCRDDAGALNVARYCPVYAYIPAGRRTMLLGRSIGETDTFWNFGHESAPFSYLLEREGLASIEAKLRLRVADLLAAPAAFKGRGNRWVPEDFSTPAPTPEPATAPAETAEAVTA